MRAALRKYRAVDAGNFDRVLEGQKNARARALLRFHFQQVGAVEGHAAPGDLVFGAAGQDAGQRAFAAAVGTHDGVDFPRLDREIEALEDFLAVHAGGQIANFKHVCCHLR